MYPTWIPIPAAAGSTGGPSAGGAYAGVGAYPGYSHPVHAAANAPHVGRSRAAFRALILLVFVALVGAGAFLYLSSESTQGLGSGTHTLSAPATLGGQAQSTGSSALGSAVESQLAAEPGITGSVFTVYGSATPGSPAYILGMESAGQAVTASDLSQFVASFNSTSRAAFSLTTAVVTSDSGVSFHCAPDTLSGATAAMCVWVDGNVIGMVLGSPETDSADTLAAAEQARSTAEH